MCCFTWGKEQRWLAWGRKNIRTEAGQLPLALVCHTCLMVIQFLHLDPENTQELGPSRPSLLSSLFLSEALAESTKLSVTFLPNPRTSWSCCWENFRKDKCVCPPSPASKCLGLPVAGRIKWKFSGAGTQDCWQWNCSLPPCLFSHNTLVMVSWQASLTP